MSHFVDEQRLLQFRVEVVDPSSVYLDYFRLLFKGRTNVNVLLNESHVHQVEHPQMNLVLMDSSRNIQGILAKLFRDDDWDAQLDALLNFIIVNCKCSRSKVFLNGRNDVLNDRRQGFVFQFPLLDDFVGVNLFFGLLLLLWHFWEQQRLGLRRVDFDGFHLGNVVENSIVYELVISQVLGTSPCVGKQHRNFLMGLNHEYIVNKNNCFN